MAQMKLTQEELNLIKRSRVAKAKAAANNKRAELENRKKNAALAARKRLARKRAEAAAAKREKYIVAEIVDRNDVLEDVETTDVEVLPPDQSADDMIVPTVVVNPDEQKQDNSTPFSEQPQRAARRRRAQALKKKSNWDTNNTSSGVEYEYYDDNTEAYGRVVEDQYQQVSITGVTNDAGSNVTVDEFKTYNSVDEAKAEVERLVKSSKTARRGRPNFNKAQETFNKRKANLRQLLAEGEPIDQREDVLVDIDSTDVENVDSDLDTRTETLNDIEDTNVTAGLHLAEDDDEDDDDDNTDSDDSDDADDESDDEDDKEKESAVNNLIKLQARLNLLDETVPVKRAQLMTLSMDQIEDQTSLLETVNERQSRVAPNRSNKKLQLGRGATASADKANQAAVDSVALFL